MRTPILVDGEKAGISGFRRAPPREFARMCAKQGIGFLASAFNYDNSSGVPYRFPDAVRDRFVALAAEIVQLIEDGEIIELPHVVARNDERFQSFMETALAKPRNPRKSRRPAT